MEQQSRPVFPTYETSGYDQSNCVHAHSYLGERLFRWDIPHHQHATPDQLAAQMHGLRVDDYRYRNDNNSGSDSE